MLLIALLLIRLCNPRRAVQPVATHYSRPCGMTLPRFGQRIRG